MLINMLWRRRIEVALLSLTAIAVLIGVVINIWKAAILAQARQGVTSAILGDIFNPEEYAAYSAIIETDFVDESIELIAIQSQTSLGYLSVQLSEPWEFKPSGETQTWPAV